ncbi:MAG TPA: acyltransferase [Gemmataceae bacterium]|nr:acyltransferase [Pirellulales bacterium]HZZ82397.1 acyltransferase [Gemmataceae bacterium]
MTRYPDTADQPPLAKATHIPVLDHLRGIAAASVCLYHFTCGNRTFLPSDDPLKQLASFGWLGVESFFVISGFVIPYSLHLRSYRLSNGADFFIRRLKRLEPPYLSCILLIIVLHYLSSLSASFRGQPLELSWQRLAAHLGYLNAILEFGWLNPVFWTLAIEFQYYIFMAIAYPLLAHEKAPVRAASVLAIALFGFVGGRNSSLLPHWLPLFAIGMLTFQFYVGKLSGLWYTLLLCLISFISFWIVGSQQTAVGLATAVTMVGVASREVTRFLRPVAFLGTISYSLYLLHVPIGGRVINLASRLPESPAIRYSAIAAAFGTSIAAAFVFWFFIERRSQLWAKSSGIFGESWRSQKTLQKGQPDGEETSEIEPECAPLGSEN